MPDAIKNSGLILGNVGRCLVKLNSCRVKGTVYIISSVPIFIEWHEGHIIYSSFSR